MCLNKFCLAWRLTFAFPSQSVHGSLLKVRMVGYGWFWILSQWFFVAISIAAFQQALWDLSSSALSWWPWMCSHCQVRDFYTWLFIFFVYHVKVFFCWITGLLFEASFECQFSITNDQDGACCDFLEFTNHQKSGNNAIDPL